MTNIMALPKAKKSYSKSLREAGPHEAVVRQLLKNYLEAMSREEFAFGFQRPFIHTHREMARIVKIDDGDYTVVPIEKTLKLDLLTKKELMSKGISKSRIDKYHRLVVKRYGVAWYDPRPYTKKSK